MPVLPPIDRRHILLGAIAAAGLRSMPAWAEANPPTCTWPPPDWIEHHSFPSRRWVKIVFVHTGERFDNLYMEDGQYIVPAVQQFSHVCRDFRENKWQMLNPYLMDFLFVLHWKYCKDEISILSGF
ncbi:MAG TPA: DUF882 domain-containing protein, partial [Stellaceae bacterium]|nr:DUF882 domain-containing protein [Stellaceae bacterium]